MHVSEISVGGGFPTKTTTHQFEHSPESDFRFGPTGEVVLDAEWDSATISQETAAPGVYFVSAIITITNDVTGGWDFLEVEPIMITVTASSGDSGPAGDAP